MRRLAVGVLTLILLLPVAVPAEELPFGAAPLGNVPTATFSLDGVTLELTTAFLSGLTVVTSEPDAAIQMATAVDRAPLFRELSVTAVPFGASPPTEALPPAGPGLAEGYRAALRAHREQQVGDPQEGAMMHLFGEPVIGSRSVISLQVRGERAVPVAITEGVVEAGSRLWIVRASRELERTAILRPSATIPAPPFSGLVLSSPDLARSSTSLSAIWSRLLR